MRILLCTLTGQQIPNLLSVHHLRPDLLLLAGTPEMLDKGAAQNLIEALKLGGLPQYEQNHEIVPVADENSFDAVRVAAEDAVLRHPGAHWQVNLTGGRKIIAMGLRDFFAPLGAELYYIGLRRPDEITRYDGPKPVTQPIGHALSCAEFLRVYGFRGRTSERQQQQAYALFPLARACAAAPSHPVVFNPPRGQTVDMLRSQHPVLPSTLPIFTYPENSFMKQPHDVITYSIGVESPVTPDDPLPSLPDIPPGALVVIEGRAPIWRYGLAFHRLHGSPAGAIAVFDPKLGGVVIVATHRPEFQEGQIIPDKPRKENA